MNAAVLQVAINFVLWFLGVVIVCVTFDLSMGQRIGLVLLTWALLPWYPPARR